MKVVLPVITVLALTITEASAWKVWTNWNNNCGGDSYYTQAQSGRACLNIAPRSDGVLPRSFTWNSQGESGCTASIWTQLNCGGQLLDATTQDGTCLLGRFKSYSINC
ncbi:hypothetical protein GLAREA_07522 [Glarea lozoyensis ATCC 20868]|uniref:Uncharacterized protein n=1 Tax=Glarea lozoyensis (strain ATCC 20868 / MF5171) TaxID=1116229 RepID=S3D5K1_GLAL2|nr:uncharacterized protein GLAREA_07522 [Glarea lozoyensis ATCC 20868]EPE32389.1 hypothetical protein GLAREA_07522 [Glarea lozoyensis ATCC 20868]